MKNLSMVFAIGVLFLFSCQNTKKEVKLDTEIDSVSYALGVYYGTNMQKQELSEFKADVFTSGFESALKSDSNLLIVMAKANTVLNNFFDKKEKIKHEPTIAEGKKFLAENAKKEGVISLPSGLQYKIITEGTGNIPQLTDKVKTNYKGTLIDGTVFDSSYDRGEPAVFGVTQVIKGWTEALTLMKEGAKWELFIPYDLAYGKRDMGTIKPYSTLIFEIELISIEKADSK